MARNPTTLRERKDQAGQGRPFQRIRQPPPRLFLTKEEEGLVAAACAAGLALCKSPRLKSDELRLKLTPIAKKYFDMRAARRGVSAEQYRQAFQATASSAKALQDALAGGPPEAVSHLERQFFQTTQIQLFAPTLGGPDFVGHLADLARLADRQGNVVDGPGRTDKDHIDVAVRALASTWQALSGERVKRTYQAAKGSAAEGGKVRFTEPSLFFIERVLGTLDPELSPRDIRRRCKEALKGTFPKNA